MAKFSELDRCVRELRPAAEALVNVADSLQEFYSNPVPKSVQPPESPTPQPQQELNLPEDAPITLDDVRAVMTAKSREGKTAEVKALLTKYGATKLGEVAPERYAELLAETEAL